MTKTENCPEHAHLPNPDIKILCVQCLAEVQAGGSGAIIRDFEEAVGLLRDYARIYPNNSGRTLRFLKRLDGEISR